MRGMRVIGDLTLNHCGAGHDWFLKGREDVNSPERDFFYFDGSFPHGYVSWFGVKSLPKLDHRSHELRRRFLDGPESITGRWLRAPDGFDGWRIDVANMAGRHHDLDLTGELARAMRATMAGLGVAARRRSAAGAPPVLLGPPRRAAARRRPRRDRGDAGVPRWCPVAVDGALVGVAGQPRHRPLPHGRRRPQTPDRRHRAADDDAGSADGVRRR
jgi:hypothetical protein